jgi:YjbR protein
MDLFPLSEAEERAHRDHPDFRVGGKIFATLGYPDKSCGMVKLSPEEQHYFSKAERDVFVPAKRRLGTPRRHQRSSQSGQERNAEQGSTGRVAQHRAETPPAEILNREFARN